MEMSPISINDVLSLPKIRIQPISEDPAAAYNLIFFITGNPGLIHFYRTFLTALHESLCSSISANVFHVYGQSLAGFEDAPSRQTPYSLEEQVTILLTALEAQVIPSGPLEGRQYTTITLVGHSVGSYILLELLQRLRSSSSNLNITTGILLFPTVTHIAKSPSGIKISTLFKIPDFPRKASVLAKGLVWVTPKSFLTWLVGLVTNMPSEPAEVTTAFLQSKMGIWQALHMAKEEMDMITEDKWDEDIWGVEHADMGDKYKAPKLIFYFGQNDHWVADHTRDALIEARGRGESEATSSKPVMLIDENGVDHGFCIRHSENIAEKVKGWIEDSLSLM